MTLRITSDATQGPKIGPTLQDPDVLAVVKPPGVNCLPEVLLADLVGDLREALAFYP